MMQTAVERFKTQANNYMNRMVAQFIDVKSLMTLDKDEISAMKEAYAVYEESMKLVDAYAEQMDDMNEKLDKILVKLDKLEMRS